MDDAVGSRDPVSWVVRPIESAKTWELRGRVLRPGQTIEELTVPGEHHPLAGWFAAIGDGSVVACAGVFPEQRPDSHTGGWRLRAMATAPEVRGMGLGRLLLLRCAEHVRSHGGEWLWCSARVAAAGFYVHHGFEIVGEPHDVEGLGPHFDMEATVADVIVATEGRGL